MRSVLTRAVLALGLGLVAGLSWPQLVEHVRWQGYAGLAREVRDGRFEPADLGLLAPALARAEPEAGPSCEMLRATPVLTLHLYATDLRFRAAQEAGTAEAAETLEAHFRAARGLVERALACRPTDGDLWLTLALFAAAMDDPAEEIARYVALSRRHAPHEDWIMRRRDRFF
jgi:hypothetical protein